MQFISKRIEISLGHRNYDVHLKEFGAKFFVTGSVYHEVPPSVDLAKSALRKAAELSIEDKRKYAGAFEAIAAIVCPCGDWFDAARIRKEEGLL